MTMVRSPLTLTAAVIVALALAGGGVEAGNGPTLAPPFDEDYTVANLGAVPGLPESYGGLTFAPGQPEFLLIGGNANDTDAAIYIVTVTRDVQGHITGFAGEVEHYADAPYIDGGLAFGPGGVLFYSRYNPPMVEVGQIALAVGASAAPASELVTKVVDLAGLGVMESPGGLNFVPHGFPGAGALKLTSYRDGDWYEIGIAPAGDGTFDAISASKRADLTDGSEGIAFVPLGSPAFGTNPQVLINNYDEGVIDAYELDANGDPIPGGRQTFASGLGGLDGAAIDPLTGDLIVSDYNSPRIFRISGFAPPVQYTKGDNNCDGVIDILDALAGLLYAGGLDPAQAPECFELGEPVPADAIPLGNGLPTFGDIDCDEDVDPQDSLLILAFLAGLPLNLPTQCPALAHP